MLATATRMAKSAKKGNTLVGTLRKIDGKDFAAGYPDTATLSEVLLQLNETSLSQLRRDHGTGQAASGPEAVSA